MFTDFDALEDLTKAATQGLWDYRGHEVFLKGIDSWPVIANCRNENDAAFIAVVNPSMVLKLITELRRAINTIKKEREASNWLATMLGEYGKENGSAQEWLQEAKRVASQIVKENIGE